MSRQTEENRKSSTLCLLFVTFRENHMTRGYESTPVLASSNFEAESTKQNNLLIFTVILANNLFNSPWSIYHCRERKSTISTKSRDGNIIIMVSPFWIQKFFVIGHSFLPTKIPPDCSVTVHAKMHSGVSTERNVVSSFILLFKQIWSSKISNFSWQTLPVWLSLT